MGGGAAAVRASRSRGLHGAAVPPLPQPRRPQVQGRDDGGGAGGAGRRRRRRSGSRSSTTTATAARTSTSSTTASPTGSSATTAAGASRRRRPRRARACSATSRGRAWASPSAIRSATAGTASSSRTSARSRTASTATSTARSSKTRARPRGLDRVGLPNVRWGTHFADFDNDGWLDLYAAGGHLAPRIVPRRARPLQERRRRLRRGAATAPSPRRRSCSTTSEAGTSWSGRTRATSAATGWPRAERRSPTSTATARSTSSSSTSTGRSASFATRSAPRQSWIAIEPAVGRGRPHRPRDPRARDRRRPLAGAGLPRLAVLRLGLARPAALRARRGRDGAAVEVRWPDGQTETFRNVPGAKGLPPPSGRRARGHDASVRRAAARRTLPALPIVAGMARDYDLRPHA